MPPQMQMPVGMPMGMGHQPETNLLSILVNAAFGFVAGLMFLFGVAAVLKYGTSLAQDLMTMVGYGQMMGGFASAAPFVVLAPIGGLVLKELASVRSLKSFGFFVAAVAGGVAVSFFMQGYFEPLIH